MTLEAYRDLKSEACLDWDDNWGDCMQNWFGVAAELHYRDPSLVPVEWRYRPSPIRPDDPRERDDFMFKAYANAPTGALLRWGAVLARYAACLKRKGLDY